MATSLPFVTSDIPKPEASAAPRFDETREAIASVISTIRAQITDEPAGAMGPVSQPSAVADAVTGNTPLVPVLTRPAGSSPNALPSPLAYSTTNASNSSASSVLATDAMEGGDSAALPNPNHQQTISPPLPGATAGPPGQNQSGTAALNTGASEEKVKAYKTLMDLVQNTDASVVRQVVRENWHKCLVGSEYHSGFIVNAAINYSSPTTLNRTMKELGEKVLKSSKREIAKHLRGEDLDEVADLIGPKLGTHFQDRVMATRLETIAAQDLINALARAERLGYHINDVVKKKPGPRGETVIPSISTLLTSLPPMPPHQIHGGAPPPPMPPHLGAPPQQPQQQPNRASTGQHPVPIMLDGKITFPPASSPSQPPNAVLRTANTASQPISNQKTGIMYCSICHRPCSSMDALAYHTKKAKCHIPKAAGNLGVDMCVHCGSVFESSGGLAYHTKSYVCGKHSEETKSHLMELLRQREALMNMAPNQPINNHGALNYHMMPGQSANPVPGVIKSSVTPIRRPIGSVASPSPTTNDPYARLSPDQRRQFDAEMKQVDIYYGSLIREAEMLPPGKREEEIAKFKNRYNTKQSNTRKKYGIRLRERRTNADVDRSWNVGSADYAHSAKKARTDGGQARPVANQVGESPSMRARLSEMGGLSGSSATAELVDPTTSSTNYQPPPSAYDQAAVSVLPGAYQGTSDDPMQIDDDTSASTDSDSVDIPARIKTA